MSDYTVQLTQTTGLSYEASNGRSGVTIDIEPMSESWLPPELFLAGLGSCMLATLMAYGEKYGIDVDGARVSVTGESERGPARIGRVHVAYELPAELTEEETKTLIRAGSRCKVHNTLHHDPEIVVTASSLSAVR